MQDGEDTFVDEVPKEGSKNESSVEAPIGDEGTVQPDAAELVDGATAMLERAEFVGRLADLEMPLDPTQEVEIAEPLPVEGFVLCFQGGATAGGEKAYASGSLEIGRASECGLSFAEIAVSRHHAKIVQEDDEFHLIDSDSTNGTFLNGRRIDAVVLSPGDEITIGPHRFRFQLLEEAPEAEIGEPSAVSVVDEAPEPIVPSEFIKTRDISRDALPSEPDGTPKFKTVLITLSVLAVAVGWFVFRHMAERREQQTQETTIRVALQSGVVLVKSGNCEAAAQHFVQVLMLEPEHPRAKEYLEYCKQKAQEPPPAPVQNTPSPEPEPEHAREPAAEPAEPPKPEAVGEGFGGVPQSVKDVYLGGRLYEAKSLAEVAGRSKLAEALADIIEAHDQVRAAHEEKNAKEVIVLGQGILQFDRKIAGGRGALRREIRRYLADAHYIQALNAFHANDKVKTKMHLEQALENHAGHELARKLKNRAFAE